MLRLLPPTVRFFEPRKKAPFPSIDPTVVPPIVSPDMSKEAVALALISLAFPPDAESLKNVALPPPLFVIVALSASDVFKNCSALSLTAVCNHTRSGRSGVLEIGKAAPSTVRDRRISSRGGIKKAHATTLTTICDHSGTGSSGVSENQGGDSEADRRGSGDGRGVIIDRRIARTRGVLENGKAASI